MVDGEVSRQEKLAHETRIEPLLAMLRTKKTVTDLEKASLIASGVTEEQINEAMARRGRDRAKFKRPDLTDRYDRVRNSLQDVVKS